MAPPDAQLSCGKTTWPQGMDMVFAARRSCVPIPAPPLSGPVTLTTLLFEPQILLLRNGDNKNLLSGLLGGMNQIMSVRHIVGALENIPLTWCQHREDKAKSTILHTPEKSVEPTGKFTFYATRFVLNREGSTRCCGRAQGTDTPRGGAGGLPGRAESHQMGKS